jgi:acetolactate decarboxylase
MKLLKFGVLLTVAALLLVFGSLCPVVVVAQSGSDNSNQDTLVQISTYDYFAAGNLDGIVPLTQLHQYGDYGLGTFDKTDGEMVIVDSTIYQVPTTGKPQEPNPNLTTPFAVLAFWQPSPKIPVKADSTLSQLTAQLDQAAPNQNVFVVIRVEGTFKTLKLRSVPTQTAPYPNLADIVTHQITFDMTNISGTLVGVRSPAFAKGLNAVGYHFHFISADHQAGGHVLDLTTGEASLQVNLKSVWKLILPTAPNSAVTPTATLPATKVAYRAG